MYLFLLIRNRLGKCRFEGNCFVCKGLPRWLSDEESGCQCRRHRFDPWVGKIPWNSKWQPIPVFLPGKFHRQRSLVGYRPSCMCFYIVRQFTSICFTRLSLRSDLTDSLGAEISLLAWSYLVFTPPSRRPFTVSLAQQKGVPVPNLNPVTHQEMILGKSSSSQQQFA